MLEYECDCICHSDSTKKHCDELSCTPCCTTCKHCNKKIKLGKMVKHLLKDHGIVTPKQEIEVARNKALEALKDSKNVIVDIMSHESDRFSMVSQETEPDKEELVPLQALIVLSKAWKDYPPLTKDWEPKLSIDSKMSVLSAGEMFEKGLVKKIIFSGGKTAGLDNISEAEGMKRYLKTKFPDIPEDTVIVEGESVDTFDQAEKTLQILERYGLTRVALLTVGYQLSRAEKIFKKVGVNVEKGLASEDQLESRSSRYDVFIKKWLGSGRHLKKEVEETILRSLLFIDTEGKVLRAVTNKLRYGNKTSE